MHYRTRTYIAGDWETDQNIVQQLRKWNDSYYWSLSFTDAHELTQARDTSLNCSIKKSLKERLDSSKVFILIVGNNTTSLRSGGCQYCRSYNLFNNYCYKGMYQDTRSYIEYECEKAYNAFSAGLMKIIILYNSSSIDRNKCPQILRHIGIHIPVFIRKEGTLFWNYNDIKNVIMH